MRSAFTLQTQIANDIEGMVRAHSQVLSDLENLKDLEPAEACAIAQGVQQLAQNLNLPQLADAARIYVETFKPQTPSGWSVTLG